MKNKTFPKILTIAIPFTVILFFVYKEDIFALVSLLPTCFIYSKLHLYCPACGNTRGVTSLLEGDILDSLRYNITPVIILLFVIMAYVELATYSFGRHCKLLPRRLWFYLIIIALLTIYYITRNLVPVLAP
jgi:hypothetical protein